MLNNDKDFERLFDESIKDEDKSDEKVFFTQSERFRRKFGLDKKTYTKKRKRKRRK